MLPPFQLTRSRGAWPSEVVAMLVVLAISTHTLTWSVTGEVEDSSKPAIFQLTRSRGAWHPACGEWRAVYDFNSHAHVERDVWDNSRVSMWRISTHTLTWSVTALFKEDVETSKFQLTRSRGAWPQVGAHYAHSMEHFNSHAHVERDTTASQKHSSSFISTHTLTWSVTNLQWREQLSNKFQLTRSRGAWRAR